MAKDKKKTENEPAGGASFMMSAIVALVLGAGGGGAFGYFAMPDSSPSNSSSKNESASPAPAPIVGRFPKDAIELAVPSVITDLDTDPKIRARLDVSIIVAHGTPETTTLLGEVREDVVAYLKGLTVSDIQGVRGFQNLREQLDDRARIRGRGAVLGLLIGGLVLE